MVKIYSELRALDMNSELSMKDTERRISEIYRETREYYEKNDIRLDGEALGFRVLYGPPIRNAPYLFLGLQPGGRLKDVREAHHFGWPNVCEYSLDIPALKSAGWTRFVYATNMQKIWTEDLLRACVGLNAIFFRAPNIGDWRDGTKLLSNVRIEAEAFSQPRARQIVDLLAPRRIVVVGLGSFETLCDEGSELERELHGKRLVLSGRIWGYRAYGIKHLSGARLKNCERDVIKNFFQSLTQE